VRDRAGGNMVARRVGVRVYVETCVWPLKVWRVSVDSTGYMAVSAAGRFVSCDRQPTDRDMDFVNNKRVNPIHVLVTIATFFVSYLTQLQQCTTWRKNEMQISHQHHAVEPGL
jgi:hypothetical protein